MHHDPAKKLKELDKKIIVFSMLDAIAFIAVALAAYAKFSGYVPIHPILNNEQVIHSLFISGGAAMLWSVVNLFKLWREKLKVQKLLQKGNTNHQSLNSINSGNDAAD